MLAKISVEPSASVLTDPALTVVANFVVPSLLTMMAPKGCVSPSLSEKVTLPLPELSVNARAETPSLSTVDSKVMDPPDDANVTSPISVTAVARLIFALVVVMLPARLFRPKPDCANALPAIMSPLADVVNSPLLATVKPEPVLTRPSIVSFVPVKLKPLASVIAPDTNVRLEPASCWKPPAVTAASKLRSVAAATEIRPGAVRLTSPPTTPAKRMLPVPDVKVRL